MSFLLDTNAVSEWIKPRPNPGLMNWMHSVDEDLAFLSVISHAELSHGVELLDRGKRRSHLERWLLIELPGRFGGRILPIDDAIAHTWGRVVSRCKAAGRPIGIMDGFLAATALHHQLTLVTRDTAITDAAGVAVLNPWTDWRHS